MNHGWGILICVLCAACERGEVRALPSALGDPEKGRMLMGAYGCGGCHQIPGVVGATGTLGPPLERWRLRTYIAGRTLNTPQALVQWITDPQATDPGNAMPDLGVKPQEARHMAAYLYTLR